MVVRFIFVLVGCIAYAQGELPEEYLEKPWKDPKYLEAGISPQELEQWWRSVHHDSNIAPRQEYYIWSETRHACLNGHNDKNFVTDTIEECKKLCEVEEDFSCQSADWSPGICQLSTTNSSSPDYYEPCFSPYEETGLFADVLYVLDLDCPIGFQKIGEKCYLFSQHFGENQKTQPQARLFCQILSHESYDVDLATTGVAVNSESEPLMDFIYDNGLADGGIWLGAERNGSEYAWLDGRSLSSKSFLWHYTEPLGGDCVCTDSDWWGDYPQQRYYLASTNCTTGRNFSCEIFEKNV